MEGKILQTELKSDELDKLTTNQIVMFNNHKY